MAEPRRILMTTDAVGGVWVYATSLAAALAHEGTHVTLVTLGPAPQEAHRAALARLPAGVELVVTDLALEWLDPDGTDAARARDTLLRIADRVGADLVHLNGFREGAIPWPCPSVVVAHSCVLSWWAACRPEEPLPAQWLRYRDGVALGLANADAWVATTATFRRTVRDLYRPPAAGHVIRNGAEIPPHAATRKEPIVLASGRAWDEGKNLGALAATAPELPWQVQIAGSGAAASADPTGSPCWLGEIAHAELQRRMRQAAIYAAPARYEPFGLGILEAAASGCALVLSDIATLRELWDSAALFAPADDRAALARAIRRLCEDDAERQRLQRRARARAARYTLANTLSAYRALYNSLLGARPPARVAEPMQAEAHP
jgi:glycosyltransferase involved in cell wall biosynthesis